MMQVTCAFSGASATAGWPTGRGSRAPVRPHRPLRPHQLHRPACRVTAGRPPASPSAARRARPSGRLTRPPPDPSPTWSAARA